MCLEKRLFSKNEDMDFKQERKIIKLKGNA